MIGGGVVDLECWGDVHSLCSLHMALEVVPAIHLIPPHPNPPRPNPPRPYPPSTHHAVPVPVAAAAALGHAPVATVLASANGQWD